MSGDVDDPEFHVDRETGLPLRVCPETEPHSGHRWPSRSQRLPDSFFKVVAWCPGVSQLVAGLAESGTLEESATEEEAVNIIDEPARPADRAPSPGINADFMRANSQYEMNRTERQARYAYYAWGNMMNGRWPVTGVGHGPMPNWDELPPQLRHAWIEAARAVRSDTLNPDWARTTGADHRAAPWNRIDRNTTGG